MPKRKSAKQMAKLFAKSLRKEHPDYLYLKEIFRQLRTELKITVTKTSKQLPYVPTEEEIQRYYKNVWQTRNMQHMVLIKTLLYTGLRVSEIVNVKLDDVYLESCQIHVRNGNGGKGRKVPIPYTWIFIQIIMVTVSILHEKHMREKQASFPF